MIGIGVVAVGIRLLAGLYNYFMLSAKQKQKQWLPEQRTKSLNPRYFEDLFLILIVLVLVLLLVLHCLGMKLCTI